MKASTTGILIRLMLAGLVLTGCATGPSGAAKDQAKLLAAFEGLEPAEIIRAGDAAAASGDAERALFIYNQALILEESADAWYRIGQVFWELDKKPQAWRAYATALQLDPEYALAHEEIGLLHMAMKQQEPAEHHLKRAIELDASSWRANNALGVLADVRKDYDSAIAHYNAALDVNPGSAILLNNLGYSHYLAGNYLEAEKILRMAVGIDSSYKPAVANLGLSHARRRDYGEAVEILRQVMDDRQAYNDVGFVAYHNGDLEDAAWLLTEAIRVSPNYYEAARNNLRLVRKAMDIDNPHQGNSGPGDAEAKADAMPEGQPGRPDYRIVSAEALNVRSGASTSAPIVSAIVKGLAVEVMYELNGWAFIEFWRDGADAKQAGWARSKYLKARIDRPSESEPTGIQDQKAAALSTPAE